MPLRRFAALLALLLSTILSSACAPAAQGEASAGDGVLVRVQNNLIPPTSLTVYAVSETGTRRLLGSVNPNVTETLRFEAGAGGQYRILARTTAGQEVLSNPVSVRSGEGIRWDVQANIATALDTP
ncbi:MAG: hypothetical protein M3P24_09665 [Gemmatimonadota bacterium]|nr:hypothetical protein [Gemmatimonadota bacterium]